MSLSTDAWFDSLQGARCGKAGAHRSRRRAFGLRRRPRSSPSPHGVAAGYEWKRSRTSASRYDPPSGSASPELKPGYYTRIGTIRADQTRRAAEPATPAARPDGRENRTMSIIMRAASRWKTPPRRAGGAPSGCAGLCRDHRPRCAILRSGHFGRNGYAIVPRIARLPAVLPAIYRGLAS